MGDGRWKEFLFDRVWNTLKWCARLAVAAAMVAARWAANIPRRAFCFPCLICLGILSIIALGDWYLSGRVRRTIVFYSLEDGRALVEERFIARTGSLESDLRSFMEEVVLGPSQLDAAPLLDRETALASLIMGDKAVSIGFSEAAALPVPQASGAEGGLTHSLRSIARDVRRNFPGVRQLRFFIAGREIPVKGS